MTPVQPPLAQPVQTARASQDVERTAREFEAVFLGQIAKLMLESLPENEAFGGGHAEAIFRGVLAEHIGKAASDGPGIGLAPTVARQILMMQGSEDGQ